MSKHTTNWPVHHDGKEYAAGKTITINNEEQAAALVASGAVSEAVKEAKPSSKDEEKAAAEKAAAEKAAADGKKPG